ncbi:polyphenol oxidase family protein [Akkermansia massiliensis]
METPAFLKPIQSYPGEIVQFIERIPGVDVTGDRETVLERLEPYHKAEVEALGWRWKDLRRAEQVHGTRVALVGDIGSNYPVEGVDSLICSGVSDCVLAIYVADCAAVWLYDKENCHRSLIHSGKAGTAGNIVSNTIKSMKKCLGVDPANLIAVISPCIRPPIMRKTSPRLSRPSSLRKGCRKTRFTIQDWTRRQIPSASTPTAWRRGKRAACWPSSARTTPPARTRSFFNSGKAAPFIPFTQRITVPPWCVFCRWPIPVGAGRDRPAIPQGTWPHPTAAGPFRLFRTR